LNKIPEKIDDFLHLGIFKKVPIVAQYAVFRPYLHNLFE
tara:strand:- start:112 stop:228 length:117 start_codon:yes stop_codon:yes gene_type:complete